MRTTSSALAIVLALALTACGDDDATTTQAPTTTEAATTTQAATTSEAPTTTEAAAGAVITISGFSFGDPVSATVGQEVTVTNTDGVTHTWTSNDGLFDSGNIGSGGSFAFTFDAPGEYAFHCNIHTSMMGTITVTG